MKFVIKVFFLSFLLGSSACNKADDPTLHRANFENSYTCSSIESIRTSDEPDFMELFKSGAIYFSGTINDIKKSEIQRRSRFVIIRAKGKPLCTAYFPMNAKRKTPGYKTFTDKNFRDYQKGSTFHAQCSTISVDVSKDFILGGCQMLANWLSWASLNRLCFQRPPVNSTPGTKQEYFRG